MMRSKVVKGLSQIGIPRWEQEQIFDTLDESGAAWDPEAPELPGRVRAVPRGATVKVLTESNEHLFSVLCQTDRAEATLEELTRRYNALGRILEQLAVSHGPLTTIIRSILDEEGVTR